jgi:hypothetical protein
MLEQWDGGQPYCDGTDHTIITWGGPIAIFRRDNINGMDVIDLSVREIQPPSESFINNIATLNMSSIFERNGIQNHSQEMQISKSNLSAQLPIMRILFPKNILVIE